MSKKRIVLVPDVVGWCWWHQAEAIRKYAGEYARSLYDVRVIPYGDFSPKQTGFDAVLEFSWTESHGQPPGGDGRRWVSVIAHEGVKYAWPVTQAGLLEDYRRVASSRLRNSTEFLASRSRRNGYICVSEGIWRWVKPHVFHGMSRFIPAGVDCAVFDSPPVAICSGKLRVGFVGQKNLDGKPNTKGIPWVLEPLIDATQDYCDWKLNFRSAKDALSQGEMVDFYGGIDVLVCTSVNEGGPATTAEAMACRRPVVSTFVGDVRNYITHGVNGFFAPSYKTSYQAIVTVRAMSAILKMLHDDKRAVQAAGDKARVTMQNTRNWKTLAPQWLRYIAGD